MLELLTDVTNSIKKLKHDHTLILYNHTNWQSVEEFPCDISIGKVFIVFKKLILLFAF